MYLFCMFRAPRDSEAYWDVDLYTTSLWYHDKILHTLYDNAHQFANVILQTLIFVGNYAGQQVRFKPKQREYECKVLGRFQVLTDSGKTTTRPPWVASKENQAEIDELASSLKVPSSWAPVRKIFEHKLHMKSAEKLQLGGNMGAYFIRLMDIDIEYKNAFIELMYALQCCMFKVTLDVACHISNHPNIGWYPFMDGILFSYNILSLDTITFLDDVCFMDVTLFSNQVSTPGDRQRLKTLLPRIMTKLEIMMPTNWNTMVVHIFTFHTLQIIESAGPFHVSNILDIERFHTLFKNLARGTTNVMQSIANHYQLLEAVLAARLTEVMDWTCEPAASSAAGIAQNTHHRRKLFSNGIYFSNGIRFFLDVIQLFYVCQYFGWYTFLSYACRLFCA